MSAGPVFGHRAEVAHVEVVGGLGVTTIVRDGAHGATLQLRGEMDFSGAGLLTAVLGNQLERGQRFFRLDVSGLTFLDCAGLQEMLHARRRCLAARGSLVLVGVTARIARLLEITGVHEVFVVTDEPAKGGPTVRTWGAHRQDSVSTR